MFFKSIEQAIISNPVLISLLTFFIGLAAGHWLALGRDKRVEFNSAARPIRAWLISLASNPTPHYTRPTEIEFDIFIQKLPFWKREGFRAACEEQDSAREQQGFRDSAGGASYKDRKPIINAIHKCLPYTLLQ